MKYALFILSVLISAFVVFPECQISNTALTVKSKEPLPLSLLCEDIDSITFSNITSDGIICDSIVTKYIHTPDSVFQLALDDVDYTSFEDATDYLTVRNSHQALSHYLTETNSKGDNYEQIVDKITTWLKQQSCVDSWSLLPDKLGFEVKYTGGCSGIIYFANNKSETSKAQVAPDAFKAEEIDDPYINVASKEGEKILYNNKILCFQGCSDLLLSINIGIETVFKSEVAHYQDILDISPTAATIIYNKNIGDYSYLLRELDKSDVAIITHTHGEPTKGCFMLSSNDSRLINPKDFKPTLLLMFDEDELKSWEDSLKTYWVNPALFDTYNSGSGICLLNYCWSNKFREHVLDSPNAENQKSFAGYLSVSEARPNTRRIGSYLRLLSRGYTHSDAIEMINSKSQDYHDGQSFQYDEECNNRFFSIETKEPIARPLDDCYTVKFIIKGWKNLKKEINKIKIWYKNEPFEHPDESCRVMEYGLNFDYVFDPDIPYYIYFLAPCAVGDKITLNSNGPDFYVETVLNTALPNTLYYTLGFEYGGRIYHGDIALAEGVQPGVTLGKCIDMGLPSGTQWAAWNLGATIPTEYGGKYGWGDPTGTHTEQGWNPAPDHDNYEEILPYYGGFNPPNNISGSRLDIARAKWGDGWKLPSLAQWEELMNDEYTICQRYFLDGVRGVRIISKINGNRLFIPTDITNPGLIDLSKFWTGQLDDEDILSAKSAGIGIEKVTGKEVMKMPGSTSKRWEQLRVRPVKN